jgi:ubiquinone/menaquinone biosynthesis C-methylase UbiE
MPLYDFLAPAYDLAFEKIYLPFRRRALAWLTVPVGGTVLDLACGTGQNFPFLARAIGPHGRIIGLDLSPGMLRRARKRAQAAPDGPEFTLLCGNAEQLTPSFLEKNATTAGVDAVVCSYGFTAMRDPEAAFRAAWSLLRPKGSFLIHDIHAANRTLHARALELATHCRFSEAAWRPLQRATADFRMDYLDPSAHLFGGRLFVAQGTKPLTLPHAKTCPS